MEVSFWPVDNCCYLAEEEVISSNEQLCWPFFFSKNHILCASHISLIYCKMFDKQLKETKSMIIEIERIKCSLSWNIFCILYNLDLNVFAKTRKTTGWVEDMWALSGWAEPSGHCPDILPTNYLLDIWCHSTSSTIWYLVLLNNF